MQTDLFGQPIATTYQTPKGSLLKWIGNKFRMAKKIASYFPDNLGTYYEIFLGSGSVLATVAPARAVASDSFAPLMEIWTTLQSNPETVKVWYEERWRYMMAGDKQKRYEEIKASYNANANGPDFLFLTRSCYGGVVRFRKRDGYMSTPVGVHKPMLPETFAQRVDEWHTRVQGVEFLHADYVDVIRRARANDFVYCDPPYSHSQAILYGAQDFSLVQLCTEIAACKARGVHVALSIDGTKKSGLTNCDLPIPKGLFEREVFIEVGRSMLRRFQMDGKTLESEVVADRLLLTY